jgi:hypothetical protein
MSPFYARCFCFRPVSISRSLLLLTMWIGAIAVCHDAGCDEPQVDNRIKFGRFEKCVLIQNDQARVVLCPESGGRVLEYSLHGKNALFVSATDTGQEETDALWRHDPSAGRFDIGPELMMPKRDELFRGEWNVTRLSQLSVRLTSLPSESTGVKLVRDFTLDPESTRLACKQTIVNVSNKAVQYCHWSRTLANGAGIVLVPLDGFAKFPNRYVRYANGGLLLRPEDPNVRIRDGFLEIIGPPTTPKLGMDSMAGWVAHQQTSGLVFIKKFPTYPERAYIDAGGITLATWAPPSGVTVEIEPIGPAEIIAPGASASFTETWWLLSNEFPTDGKQVDLQWLRQQVAKLR